MPSALFRCEGVPRRDLLEGGIGDGSGIVVSAEGDILTNAQAMP